MYPVWLLRFAVKFKEAPALKQCYDRVEMGDGHQTCRKYEAMVDRLYSQRYLPVAMRPCPARTRERLLVSGSVLLFCVDSDSLTVSHAHILLASVASLFAVRSHCAVQAMALERAMVRQRDIQAARHAYPLLTKCVAQTHYGSAFGEVRFFPFCRSEQSLKQWRLIFMSRATRRVVLCFVVQPTNPTVRELVGLLPIETPAMAKQTRERYEDLSKAHEHHQ